MSRFSFLRLPFRGDPAFSALALGFFIIPLAFSLYTYENFETPKFAFLAALLGLALVTYKAAEAANANADGGKSINPVRADDGIKLPSAFEKTTVSPLALPVAHSNGVKFFWHPIFALAAGLFGVFAIAAFFLSPDKLTAFFGFYPRLVNGLLFYLLLFLWLFLLAKLLDRQKYIFLLKIFLFDALLVSVYGLFQSAGLGLYSGLDPGGLVRPPSFIGNPNFASMFVLPAVPLLFVFLLQSSNWRAKIYYGLNLFLALWALAVFSSRGAFLGLLAAFLLMAIFILVRKSFRKFWLPFIFMVITAAAVSFAFIGLARPGGVKDTLTQNDNNISVRFYVWDLSFKTIFEKPLTGVGLGNFYEYYQSQRGSQTAAQPSFDDPHNLFLLLSVTGGVFFAAAFLAMIIIVFFLLSKQAFNEDGDFLPAALASGLAAWALAANFTPVPVGCFMVLLLFLSGQVLLNQPLEIKLPVWRFRQRPLAKAGGFLLILFGLWFFAAEHVFFQGLNAFYSKNYEKSIKYLKVGVKLNPINPIYRLYLLGSEIKSYGATPEVVKALDSFYNPNSVLFSMRSANLDFLMYQKTQDPLFADRAIAKVEKVIAVNPNQSERLARAAFYSYHSGRKQEALAYVKRALVLDPKFFPAWLLYSKLYQEQGQRSQMLFGLAQLYKNYPDDEYAKRLFREAKKIKEFKDLPFEIQINYDRLE